MRGRAAAIAMLALLLSVPAPGHARDGAPGPAGFAVSVEGRLGRCALSGLTTAGLGFDLEHRSAEDVLRGTYRVTADTDGRWTASCSGNPLLARDVLRFLLIGGTSPFKTVTVPDISLVLDRVDDRIRGRSPGDATPEIVLHRCGPGGLDCVEVDRFDGQADPGTQRYAWDLGRNARGGWRARMTWREGANTFHLERAFPFVQVRLGSARVVGDGARFLGSVTVALRRGALVGGVTTAADQGGFFAGILRLGGTRMKVRAGDLVTSDLARDVSFVVPPVSLLLETGFVSGRCFPGQRVIIRAQSPDLFDIDQRTLLASPTGDWGSVLTFGSGWTVTLLCGNRKGDVVSLVRVAD